MAARSRPNRFTQAQLEAELRRIVVRLRVDAEERGYYRYPEDDDLAVLTGLRRIADAVDNLIDHHIERARRREHRGRDGTATSTPVSWKRIGEALRITGQAAGKRAHTRLLDLTPPPRTQVTSERYRELVAEGRRLVAQRGHSRSGNRPPAQR